MNRLNEIEQQQANGAALDDLHKIRVIGIYAHIDAGKTTTSEAILYLTGRIHRAGSVDEGNTQLDWMEQERERGITITAAATTCAWRGQQIHLIDTPGHIDFTAEVMRSIRVIDGAVVVLCGVGGVETQTETVWRQAQEQDLPRLIFINKLDRETADFAQALASTRKRLTPNAVALQIPIGSGDSFRGVVDLLAQKALVWQPGSDEPLEGEVPPALLEQVSAARSDLLDAICETDEALLEQRLEGIEPAPVELRAALRRATIAGQLHPLLCGSARRRIGIQPLLDAIADYLPAPLDVPPAAGVASRRRCASPAQSRSGGSLSARRHSRSWLTRMSGTWCGCGFSPARAPWASRSPTRAPARRSASGASTASMPTAASTLPAPARATWLPWWALNRPSPATRFASPEHPLY